MIKRNLLEAKLKEREVWYSELCEELNLSYQSLYKRLVGRVEFKVGEVIKIKKFLNLSLEETDEIFYS